MKQSKRPVGVEHPTAYVHREIARRLLEHLDAFRFEPRRVVEWSVPTGIGKAILGPRFAAADSLQLVDRPDAAAAPSCVVCAPQRIPLADACTQLVLSNLALHRCADTRAALHEFARVLIAGGHLMLSAFGPDTAVETAGPEDTDAVRALRRRFLDMHELGDIAVAAGLADVVLETERLSTHCADLHALLRDWHALGEAARCADHASRRGLAPSHAFRSAQRRFDSARGPAGVAITLEIIYLHAIRPEVTAIEVAPPVR